MAVSPDVLRRTNVAVLHYWEAIAMSTVLLDCPGRLMLTGTFPVAALCGEGAR